MKQALKYSTKVWLTALTIAYATMMAFVFFGLSQPDHSKELDPFFGTIVFLIGNIFMVPSWFVFTLMVLPITKRINTYTQQKIALNVIILILLAITFSPVLITHVSDETYYPIAGCYLIFFSIALWVVKVPSAPYSNPVETKLE